MRRDRKEEVEVSAWEAQAILCNCSRVASIEEKGDIGVPYGDRA
jgi:hypothetical protein